MSKAMNETSVKSINTEASSVEQATQSFEVLYYKRTNKVHKSKGVCKLDGILSVAPPPSCVVTLHVENTDSSDDNDDDDDSLPTKGSKWNKRKRPPPQSKSDKNARNKGIVWSGINREISKRVFGESIDGAGVHVDDFIILPQWECQVVNILRPVSSCRAVSDANGSNSQTKIQGVSRGLPNAGAKRTIKRRVLVSATRHNLLANTNPYKTKRAPPRQPAQQSLAVTNNQEDCHQEPSASTCQAENCPPQKKNAPKHFVSPLLKAGKKRKLVTTTAKRNLASTNKKGSTSDDMFVGAIGPFVVPPSVRAVLRPHQQEGVTFLWNCLTGASPALRRAIQESGSCPHKCESNLRGSILADEMGLGKTLMTISIIFALHRRRNDHRFIVVCPSSLVANWGKEFDKWIGKASQPKRVVIRKGGEEGLATLRGFVPIKPHQSEVLIISYDLFRMNASILTQAKQIGLLVVDEGHRLKNTSGSLTLTALQALNCEARLLVTGTPIQNNLSEFYNIANFVCPGLLGDLSSFRRVYERPISAANNKTASWEQRSKGQAQSRALENITKTFMLRRLQKDILKSLLPPRSEFLLFCRPSQVQCNMYKTTTSKVFDSSATVAAGVSAEALTVLTSLRKLCSHPSLVRNKLQAETLCGTNGSASNAEISLSGKLVVLERLLACIRSCSPSDKVVIVSNFTSVLSVIEKLVLCRNHWSFKRLDGSTDQCERQNLVDSFNRSTPQQNFVFLLSSKAGGCGLNLIGANRLIMVDADWNPATDMQAMARIYRQGQKKPCFVYRLFLSGTVEEVIFQRQYQKGNLANLTVDGNLKNSATAAPSKGFTKEELRDCFTLKENCACDTKRKVGNIWPDYHGVATLQNDLCCQDEPLLAVADKASDTLAFVHVVKEEDTNDNGNDIEKEKVNPATQDRESNDGGSSDEEYEFE